MVAISGVSFGGHCVLAGDRIATLHIIIIINTCTPVAKGSQG